MDIFQLVGDLLHLIAVLLLLLKITATKNVTGLSYRTQEMFLVVFITRYLDMFITWRSLYLFLMKLVFIGVTAQTIRLIRFKKFTSLTYDKELDSFPHVFLYIGAGLLAAIVHKSIHPMDLLWSFSIWLEAVAVLPQLLMISRTKSIENITGHYVLFLGMYRGFYILHWIFHWQVLVFTSFAAGVLQTVFYADFIYYFLRSDQTNAHTLNLPV